MERKVLRVDQIELAILKSNPPQLSITAIGIVSTPGWRNPRLVEYIYVQPPPDGIYDFDFIAEAPEVPVPQVPQPVITTHVWSGRIDELKGVRVHASANSMEKILSAAREIRLDL